MNPIAKGKYLLKKYPGKGGWTYAEIPSVKQDPKNPFGWVQVQGSIDGFPLKQYKLMPMGEGRLFLPVKTEIRKKIKKEAGDHVEVILYLDESPIDLTPELTECLRLINPQLVQAFQQMKEGEQKFHLDQIHAAKSEKTKDQRINNFIDELSKLL